MPFFPKNTGGSGSGSGGTFNGGTITTPLTINTTGVGLVNESAQISPGGLTCQNGAYCVERFCIVTPVISVTSASTTPIFTVPAGFYLLFDFVSVITAAITSPGATAATVSIGDTVNGTGFYCESLTCPQSITDGTVSDVQVFFSGTGQSMAAAGAIITLSTGTLSTASSQQCYCVIQGVLIPS